MKALLQLIIEEGMPEVAGTNDLAAYLGIKSATVTAMLKN